MTKQPKLGHWLYLLLALTMLTTPGCGGCSSGPTQADLLRAAMVNNGGDDDEDDAPAPPPQRNTQNDDEGASANENGANENSANVNNAGETNVNPRASGGDSSTADNGQPEVTGSQPTTDEGSADSTTENGNETTASQLSGEASTWTPTTTLEERRQQSIDHMTAITRAILKASQDRKGQLPNRTIANRGDRSQPLLSWRVAILPYLTSSNGSSYQWLYDQFRINEPWDSDYNLSLLELMPNVYRDPQQAADNFTTIYMVPVSTSSAFPLSGNAVLMQRIEDPLRQTGLLIEADPAVAVPWTKPGDIQLDRSEPRTSFGALYPDGHFVAFASGQVRLIKREASARDVFAMFTIDGGESFFFERVTERAVAELPSTDAEVVAGTGSQPNRSGDNSTSSGVANVGNAGADTTGTGNASPFVGRASVNNVAADFNQMAIMNLSEGHLKQAFQAKHASLLADDPKNAVAQFGWCEGLTRPLIGLRWGIGVDAAINPNNNRGPEPITTEDKQDLDRFRSNLPGEDSVEYFAGELGLRMLSMLRNRYSSGKFGSFAMTPHEESPVRRVREGRGKDEEFPTVWHDSGIQLIGEGSRRVLTHVAQRYEVDLVVIFELELKYTRTNQIYNSTTIRFIDAHTGLELYSPRALNNIRVELDREDRLKEDPVIEVFGQIRDFLDEQLVLSTLPAQEPEQVRVRLHELMQQEPPENPLPLLSEVHLYLGQGLISEYEYRETCSALAQDQEVGELLLTGSPREKKEFLEKFIDDPNEEY